MSVKSQIGSRSLNNYHPLINGMSGVLFKKTYDLQRRDLMRREQFNSQLVYLTFQFTVQTRGCRVHLFL
uniref:Uncharacterized protein n=1 Tax=Anguilla anguilla TaxID=7936 RepID=A0A0E9RR00_ANGAN